jgi:hypothetical protein
LFFKNDTQGTELDILKSGETLLRNSIMGVHVEVEFHQFYEEQPLFSDVDNYLRNLGFSLFDLNRALHRRANFRKNYTSQRQVVWAHALYLKEADEFLCGEEEKDLLNASRLLSLALTFEHYDFALELVSTGKTNEFFQSAYGDRLLEDVESIIRQRTDRVLKRARSERPPRSPFNFLYRDLKK